MTGADFEDSRERSDRWLSKARFWSWAAFLLLGALLADALVVELALRNAALRWSGAGIAWLMLCCQVGCFTRAAHCWRRASAVCEQRRPAPVVHFNGKRVKPRWAWAYVMDENGEPRAEPDLVAWALWFEEHREQCQLAHTQLDEGHVHISTIFRAINPDGPSQLFETMVFDDRRRAWNLTQVRNATSGEAMKTHRRLTAEIGARLAAPEN